jgi:hypothetical protein
VPLRVGASADLFGGSHADGQRQIGQIAALDNCGVIATPMANLCRIAFVGSGYGKLSLRWGWPIPILFFCPNCLAIPIAPSGVSECKPKALIRGAVPLYRVPTGDRPTNVIFPESIGLSLPESKSILAAMQTQLVQAQTDGYCDHRLKCSH